MVVIERPKRNTDRRVPSTQNLAGLLTRFGHLADLRRPAHDAGGEAADESGTPGQTSPLS
jgi:hypothetical protein